MFDVGAPELIVILVIVLVVFGAGKLPNVMRDLGLGVREFKKAQSEPSDADDQRPPGLSAASHVTSQASARTAATVTAPAAASTVPAAPSPPMAPNSPDTSVRA